MSLQLDDQPVEPIHKEFYGRFIDIMPELLAENRTPASIAYVMDRRLNATGNAKKLWQNNYFFTADGVARHPDGRAKIILDCDLLKQVTPKTKLQRGAIPINEDLYEKLNGKEFSAEDVGGWHGKSQTLDEANSNPVWNFVARDQNLLQKYTKLVFNLYDKAMPLYFENAKEAPELRALCLDWLGYGSCLDCDDGIGDCDARLVGVLNGAEGATQNSSR